MVLYFQNSENFKNIFRIPFQILYSLSTSSTQVAFSKL